MKASCLNSVPMATLQDWWLLPLNSWKLTEIRCEKLLSQLHNPCDCCGIKLSFQRLHENILRGGAGGVTTHSVVLF